MQSSDYESYDFSGGVNKRLSPLKLQPNELADAQNMVPEERGTLRKRYGFTAVNAVQAYASKKVTGLLKFYGAGLDDMLVAACGPNILSVPATGASTNLGTTAGFTIDDGTDVYMAQHRDWILGTAWGTTNKRMFVIAEDPQTAVTTAMAFPMGQPPVNAPTIAAGASGSLTEGHTLIYAYSYQYGEDGALGETNTSPNSSTFTVTSTNSAVVTYFGAGKDYATAAAALDKGVNTVSIYRTHTGATTLFWLKDIDLTDSDTGAWTDDGTEDEGYPNDVTEAIIPETDNYGRHAAKYLCINNDQVFYGHIHDGTDYHPTMVEWAPPGEPCIRRASNYTTGSSEHGAVMGLASLNGTTYVFYESAIGALVVYDGASNEFRIVTTKAGVKAPRSLVVGKEGGMDVAFFLSYDHQVYAFNGAEARPISDDIQPVLSSEAEQDYMHTCAGGWDGESYYLSYPEDGESVPTRELRYNTQVRKPNATLGYDTGTWWPQVFGGSAAPNVYHQQSGASDAGELLWGNSANAGWIFQHKSGNDDNGNDITYYGESGVSNLGLGGVIKRLRTLLVDVKSYTQMTFRWDTDWNGESGVFTVPDGTDQPLWGTAAWGDFYWGGEIPRRTKYPFDSHTECRHFRWRISGKDSASPTTFFGFVLRVIPVRGDEPS